LAGSASLHILANYNLPLNRALGFIMDKSEKNLLLWSFIYWVACVNTITAIGFTLLTEAYDYSYSISATKLALICATLQFLFFKYQGELPFYKQFGVIFLATFIYMSFLEVGSNLLNFNVESLGMYLTLVFMFSLPLVLVSYFVKFRLYRYSEKPNKQINQDK
jgi:hypothetical protein